MEKITIQSDINKMNAVEAFISDICDTYNINNYAAAIAMSLIPAVENAIVHGNNSDPSKIVTISCERCRGGVTISVSDMGDGFDYSAFGDIPTSDEKGVGIYMMKTLSDQLSFENNGSTVRMTFFINGIDSSRALERSSRIKEYYSEKVLQS